MLGQYVHFVTTELQLPVALVVLLLVLLVRPAGLLGRVVVRRV
jgi:branched-chain amino acid transport system permease protein